MDIHDKLEQAEEDIFNVNEAIEYLELVNETEDVIVILKDMLINLERERDRVHKLVEADDARELDALTGEYWRSVL